MNSSDSTEELLNTVIYSTIVKGFTMSRQHDQASRLPVGGNRSCILKILKWGLNGLIIYGNGEMGIQRVYVWCGFVQNRGIRSQFYERQVSSGKSMDDAWDGIVFQILRQPMRYRIYSRHAINEHTDKAILVLTSTWTIRKRKFLPKSWTWNLGQLNLLNS